MTIKQMRTKKEIEDVLRRAKRQVIEETASYEMMPWDILHIIRGKSGPVAAIMALQWALGLRDDSGFLREVSRDD